MVTATIPNFTEKGRHGLLEFVYLGKQNRVDKRTLACLPPSITETPRSSSTSADVP